MLVRLLYASRAATAVDADALNLILKRSKANNPALGVTGVLCYSGGLFMQALEGGRDAVNRLYNRICADPLHSDVVLLGYEEITERRFVGWAMGQANLAQLNPGLLLKYSETEALDPYAMSAQAARALFDELVATASVCGRG